MEEHEGEDHHSRASVCPPSELDRRIVAMGQRTFDQDSMDGDEEGREYAIDQGKGRRDRLHWEVFRGGNPEHEPDGHYSRGNDDLPRRRSASMGTGYGNGQRQYQSPGNLRDGERFSRRVKRVGIYTLVRTWKKDASTSRRQRVLKTRPMMLTPTTGTRDLATLTSNLGISILLVKAAETCKRMTAINNWMRRKNKGRSGAWVRTALLLEDICELMRPALHVTVTPTHTKTIYCNG